MMLAMALKKTKNTFHWKEHIILTKWEEDIHKLGPRSSWEMLSAGKMFKGTMKWLHELKEQIGESSPLHSAAV